MSTITEYLYIGPYEYHTDLCDELCSADPLAGKNFTFIVGHYRQTVPPNVFLPYMRIGTTDFYHFIPLSLALTLHGGQREVKPIGFTFSHTLHLIRTKFDVLIGAIQAEHPETTKVY